MSDWHYGVMTTLIVLPLWSTWVSGNKVKLFQRGVIEPFMIGFLSGLGVSVASIVTGDWERDEISATKYKELKKLEARQEETENEIHNYH